ncbi:MAG: MFS transporter [Azospirillaceae bacterium]|nr:MFS transporter [Azospirillaceae bacterium]
MTGSDAASAAGGDKAPAWPPAATAYWGLAMLVVTYALAILDRVGLGLLVQPIEASLHITDAQMGLLQGAAFAVFYAVLGLPMGLVADRADRRLLIVAGLVLWSLATMACGLAASFIGLFVARIFVGIGEATLTPAGTSMIGDYFPPRIRARAFGIFALGTAVGAGTAFLLTGKILQLADYLLAHGPQFLSGMQPWQVVFLLFGAPGLVLAPIFAATVREPARLGDAGALGRVSLKPLMAAVAQRRQVYAAIIVSGTASSICLYALYGWFPSFLIRVHGWAPADAAHAIGLYGVPCGAVSCVASGWLVSLVETRRRGDAPIVVALASFLVIAIGGVLLGLAPTGTVAMAAYMVLSLALNAPVIGLLTVASRVAPNRLRAQVMALMGLVNSLLSQVLGPFTVGLLSDNVFGREKGLGLSIMTVILIVSILAVVSLAWSRRAYAAAIAEIDG